MQVIRARFDVVADDEYHLGMFPAHGHADGELIRLFPGELPTFGKERKALKPDLEALTRLPPFPAYPHGALFALWVPGHDPIGAPAHCWRPLRRAR